jgi:predicted Zn-dependent protease
MTPIVEEDISKTQEDGAWRDVAEFEGPAPGLRTVTFTDWQDLPTVADSQSHRTRRSDPCQESGSYKFFSGGVRWQEMPITYRFSNIPNEDWKNAIRHAFATWDDVSSSLSIQEDPSSSNVIGWAPLDGPGRALAQTSFSYSKSSRKILQFLITFDSSESWGVLETETCPAVSSALMDVEDVAVHEIGHALGLAHASRRNDRALTMYPSAAAGETHKRSPGSGDRAGIISLYP